MRKCFLCQKVETESEHLDTHHIFGAGNRWKSDKYGLTVLLCRSCHNEPPLGAHYNAETMLFLHRYGQQKAMRENNWTTEKFIEVFGKNYL